MFRWVACARPRARTPRLPRELDSMANSRPHACAYGPEPEGERISEGLRRRLADIESGRVKTVVYPGANEYIRHLDALLDG